MTFKPKVCVQTLVGRYLYSTHAANAENLCARGQAIPITPGLVQLVESLGSIRREYEASVPKVPAPKRRYYHQHTAPQMNGLHFVPCLFRADSGQIASLKRVSFRSV